jgi:hypothetical protein
VGYGQKNGRAALFPGTALEYGRSTPSHYGAFTMVRAGFVEPILLDQPGVYEVRSAGTGRYNVFRLSTRDPKEYFLIENRQPEGSDLAMGVKSAARGVGGIAIWHVNESFGKNGDKDKQMVTLEEASEGTLGQSQLKQGRGHVALDPFYPLPGATTFGPESRPGNLTCAGEPQPWTLTDFSAPGPVMTFRLTFSTREPL